MNCYARLDGDTLIVGNPFLERRWRVVDGTLQASSIRAGDREWLLAPVASPAPCTATLTTTIGRAGPTEAESLVAELVTNSRRYRLQIFPDSAGIILQSLNPNTAAAAAPAGAVASGIERPATAEELPAADRLEDWQLPAPHLRLTQVRLLDQTDIHNELVFENEWLLHPNEAWLELTGNLFLLEDTLTGDGLICLKLGPLPHARPVKSAADLRVSGTGMCHYKAGQSLAYRLALYGTQYPAALLAYQRGGRTAVLQQFQRQFRRLAPRFLSNTWGDRSRDARINEPFLLAEIEAGAQLGVDVVQIDDGWQRGRTANSAVPGGVWEGFWATDANFWDAHPARFPHGLAPVIAAAQANGMEFGLWFGPDSANDFAHWERDAATILRLHRELGVNYFKIDGVKARTVAGEANLRRFFDRVLAESAGRVVFDLDVTAETRPGYFGLLHVGPLFVENRYVDYHRYWPHHTLRNLWKLAHYVDPARLRMEFLNHARHADLYATDPLAPAAYSPAYLFATTMFANPLGWFEVSNLPARYFEQIAPLVNVWKQHRDALFAVIIEPIGAAPDGTSWTGFHSSTGYALVFRELNDQPRWDTGLPAKSAVILAGNGAAEVRVGRLVVEIPKAQNFLFLKLN